MLAANQLVERHRRRGLKRAEIASVSLATAQVAGELMARRHDRSPGWPIVLASGGAGWLVFWWGRNGSDDQNALRGWEGEWTNWLPIFARLVDDDHARRWSVLSAAPHLGVLARPSAARTRGGAIAGLVLVGAADAFGTAFGTALRRRADRIDAQAAAFVTSRTVLEGERASEAWRKQTVGRSTDVLRKLRAATDAPGAQATMTVQSEYEALRLQLVQAGSAGAVAGDADVASASALDDDVQELAQETRRALRSLNRYIAFGSLAMVALGMGSSPPARRPWVAAAPISLHAWLLSRPSRGRHLRGEAPTGAATNADLACLALAYHVADVVTSVAGQRRRAWATTSVASLAMPAAAGASTWSGALIPALGYSATRLLGRRLWSSDATDWVEGLNSSLYFTWMSWALFRAIDAIWRAEARLEHWTTESGRHAARVVIESSQRKVQLALHDHGVQTLRYLARQQDLPLVQRLEVLDRAIAELSSVATPREDHRGQSDISWEAVQLSVRECADGYRRFGLVPQWTPANDLPSVDRQTQAALIGALNQALSNVLAHTEDRSPRVEMGLVGQQLELIVSNDSTTPFRGGRRGFGLSHVEATLAEVGGSLSWDLAERRTRLRVRCPL